MLLPHPFCAVFSSLQACEAFAPRLLKKAGLIKLGKDTGRWGTTTPVAITAKGQYLLKQIQGVSQSKEKDGTAAYVVPIAERKLVAISKINKIGTGRATVEITWKWDPNQLANCSMPRVPW